MADNTLLNYLRTVLKLETECRTLSLSMNRNRQQVAALSSYNNQEKPQPLAPPSPDIPPFMVLMGALFSVTFLASLYQVIDNHKFSVGALIGLIFLGGIAALCIVPIILEINSQDKEFLEDQKRYKELLLSIEQQKEKNKQAFPVLDEDYRIMEQQYQKTHSLLQKYYDLNILYPKYRGLVPVAMFVQYFASGRVSKLEGHTGAYNLYEYELLQNVIISKLDTIISKLDQIRDAQYELANALQESNQQISRLSYRMDVANQHLEVQAYNTMQTNAEVKALKDYTIFRDLLR